MRVRLPGTMAQLACSQLLLLVSLLALCHEGLSQKTPPASAPAITDTCQSLYDVVKRTPELSSVLALINMVRGDNMHWSHTMNGYITHHDLATQHGLVAHHDLFTDDDLVTQHAIITQHGLVTGLVCIFGTVHAVYTL